MVVGARSSGGEGWKALDPPTRVRISPGLLCITHWAYAYASEAIKKTLILFL